MQHRSIQSVNVWPALAHVAERHQLHRRWGNEMIDSSRPVPALESFM